VVSIDYAIRLRDGKLVEASTGAPLNYLHGHAQIVPGLERALDGMQAGEELVIELAPDDGYGERDPQGTFLVPRAAFPPDEPVAEGMTFSATRPDGEPVTFRVVTTDDELVLVDTNHPLAGQTVVVWVAVRAVRAATGEELREEAVDEDQEAPPPLLS
jgi:FKBP-type peptidyl-prolyl cis-trans isomerase SlyD